MDSILRAPPDIDPSACAVEVLRSRWPSGVFLDAGETELVELAAPAVLDKLPSREFFLFSDRATAEAWDELGPCDENWNRMIHVLWDEQADESGPYTRVTVVVDEVTPDIQKLFDELQAAFDRSERLHRETV